MKNSLLIVFFFLGIVFPSFSANQEQVKIDSLLNVVNLHPNDSNGVKAYMGMVEIVYLSDPAKAEFYSKKAKSIAEKIQFYDGETDACGWLAFLFEQRGAIDSALIYYDRSLALSRKMGYKKNEAIILNNIAAIYKDQGKIKEALDNYQQGIAIDREIKNMDGVASIYNNIGLIYFDQGQIQQALDYYNQSLLLEDSLKDKGGIATSLHNIAGVYKDQKQYDEAMDYGQRSLKLSEGSNDKYSMGYDIIFIGSIYEEEGKISQALNEYKKSLQIRESIDDKQGMAYSLRYIGAAYEKLDSIPKAFSSYSSCIELFDSLEDKSGMSAALSKFGNLYLLSGDTAKAREQGLRSLTLAKELGYPVDIRDAAELLEKVYRKEGMWESALEMKDLFSRMRDSVSNIETHKSAMKDKFRYEYEKKAIVLKAEQDEKINEQKIFRNAFIVGFILVLLLAGALYNRYKIKLNANLALTQKNEIISEEKERSEKLLLNILPADIATELKTSGAAKAKDYESVTVMFTDFKDFTKVGEKLSPQELVNEIDYYFKAFDDIIGKYRIEKIKTIGDAYMCASGIPTAYENHADEMVNAAIEIRDFMKKAKKEKLAKGEPVFEIRIGINTGPLIAGVVGTTKFTYDIWGDSVNIASRMESNSESGKINISSSTHELVKEKYVCIHRGKIEAKNKGMIDMYFVESNLN
jgi:class 3 adenylate cyclase/Tfp pilus assembly protein PilF